MIKYSKDIEPRRLRFHPPADITKFCHHGEEIFTYHFNAIAIFLPLLENLVVLSLKKARNADLSEALKAQLNSLIAQEAIHGAEFHRFNLQTISKYYSLKTKNYNLRFLRVLAGMINAFSKSFHYGFSAAGEHLTAISSDLFLREPMLFKNVEPSHAAIWRWHCIEEIEHKAVAFDVFQALNGNYFVRVISMLIITIQFTFSYTSPIFTMMKKDKNCFNMRFYYNALKFYWGKHGVCRKLLKPYFDYFKPSFHPNKHENYELIEQWKNFFSNTTLNQAAIALQNPLPPHS